MSPLQSRPEMGPEPPSRAGGAHLTGKLTDAGWPVLLPHRVHTSLLHSKPLFTDPHVPPTEFDNTSVPETLGAGIWKRVFCVVFFLQVDKPPYNRFVITCNCFWQTHQPNTEPRVGWEGLPSDVLQLSNCQKMTHGSFL